MTTQQLNALAQRVFQLTDAQPPASQDNPIAIEVTAQHIALLRRLWVYWCWDITSEHFIGVPRLSLNRPYGNSDILTDIAEIVGLPLPDYANGADWTDAQIEQLALLHRGAGYALEIMLQQGHLAPGRYQSLSWEHTWTPVKDN